MIIISSFDFEKQSLLFFLFVLTAVGVHHLDEDAAGDAFGLGLEGLLDSLLQFSCFLLEQLLDLPREPLDGGFVAFE